MIEKLPGNGRTKGFCRSFLDKNQKTKETEWIKDNSESKIRNVQFFHMVYVIE